MRPKMVSECTRTVILGLIQQRLGMEVDDEVLHAIEESDEQPNAPDVFLPGVHQLGKDEVLEADESVYIMRHSMNVNWPCLSFDILRDNLGDERQRFPATAFIVAGTQADVAKNNEIAVYKMSSLHKTQKSGGKRLQIIHVSNVSSFTLIQTIPTRRTMRTKTC
jgi:hypothetical protein